MTPQWTADSQDLGLDADILCRDLVKIFVTSGVEVQALQGLTLRVERGELAALIGASGSGKSTLLSVLSGQLRPTGGTAYLGGQNLVNMSRQERTQFARRKVGFVWQQADLNLLGYLTAAQNIALPLTLGGDTTPKKERASRVNELIELLGLTQSAHKKPHEMSGGEQQKVAIAVALAAHPQVLLADEPTGELDDEASHEVLDAFRMVNRTYGTTTLIVTHDPAIADHVERTIAIRDGRTSVEVLRRTEADEHGRLYDVVEEFAVIDQVGRLQLPSEFVAELQLRDRVRVQLGSDHVQIRSGHSDDQHREARARTKQHERPRAGRHSLEQEAVLGGEVTEPVGHSFASRTEQGIVPLAQQNHAEGEDIS